MFSLCIYNCTVLRNSADGHILLILQFQLRLERQVKNDEEIIMNAHIEKEIKGTFYVAKCLYISLAKK